MSSPVEQDVPKPSYEELMKQLAKTQKHLAYANKELDAIEKQREKMPIKLYKIHRKIHLEFVGGVKVRTVDEAKQIAEEFGFVDYSYAAECGFKLISEKDVLYKKKDDPVINPNAQKYESLTYKDVIDRELKVMDLTAMTLCKENDLHVVVFNIGKEDSLTNIFEYKKEGSIISNKELKW